MITAAQILYGVTPSELHFSAYNTPIPPLRVDVGSIYPAVKSNLCIVLHFVISGAKPLPATATHKGSNTAFQLPETFGAVPSIEDSASSTVQFLI